MANLRKLKELKIMSTCQILMDLLAILMIIFIATCCHSVHSFVVSPYSYVNEAFFSSLFLECSQHKDDLLAA